MGFADFLAAQNLAPAVTARVQEIYGTPDGAPPAPLPENFDAPTAADFQQYGASAAEAGAAQRYNAPAAVPSQSATNPTKADPNWDPDKEAKKTAQLAHEAALANANPVAPAAEGDGEPAMVTTPGRYVPGGWRDTARSETVHHGLDPSKLAEGQKQRAIADNYGAWANDDVAKAAAKEGAADAAYAAAHEQASVLERERARRIENEKQAYIIREHEKLEELSVAAQAQVDPEAAKGSSGAQLFAALGIALGQFGASLNGGTNAALQIVNANIDRNIKAQEANINNAHRALSNEQGLYKENLAAFGDKERASLATKMQYLDQAKAVLDGQYANAKSNRNDAQYHAMSQGLADRRAEVADRFGTLTSDQSTTQGQQHYQPGGMVGGSAGVGDKGKEELFVPELGVYARTKEEAVALRGTAHRTQNTVRELGNAKALIEEAKNTTDPRKLAIIQRKLKGVAARAAVTATVKEGQGAMSDGDRAVSEAGLGLADIDLGLMSRANPLSPSIDSHAEVIDEAMRAHQQEFGRMGSGQQRGREVYAKDPVTGKVESRRVLSGSNAATRNKVDNVSDLIQAPVGQSQRKK